MTKLYSGGKLFACRKCYRLTYGNQQETARFRGLHKARQIRMRLGGGANVLEAFPPKPRGMHWRTYDRLQAQHDAAASRSMASLMRFVKRYGGACIG